MLRTLAKEWGKLLHERLGKLHGKGLGKLQGGLKTLEGECGNAEKGCGGTSFDTTAWEGRWQVSGWPAGGQSDGMVCAGIIVFVGESCSARLSEMFGAWLAGLMGNMHL